MKKTLLLLTVCSLALAAFSQANSCTPTVTITSNKGDTVCGGDTITFTAHATNGGSNPLFTWYNGGSPQQTGSWVIK
jgi:hypothetical protein